MVRAEERRVTEGGGRARRRRREGDCAAFSLLAHEHSYVFGAWRCLPTFRHGGGRQGRCGIRGLNVDCLSTLPACPTPFLYLYSPH